MMKLLCFLYILYFFLELLKFVHLGGEKFEPMPGRAITVQFLMAGNQAVPSFRTSFPTTGRSSGSMAHLSTISKKAAHRRPRAAKCAKAFRFGKIKAFSLHGEILPWRSLVAAIKKENIGWKNGSNQPGRQGTPEIQHILFQYWPFIIVKIRAQDGFAAEFPCS